MLTLRLIGTLIGFFAFGSQEIFAVSVSPLQVKLRDQANTLLEEAEVSYVYGGGRLGEGQQCEACNSCLSKEQPEPKERLVKCPACSLCSLDCSHFVSLVFNQTGIPLPYLTTSTMLSGSAKSLRSNYRLLDLGQRVNVVQVGDLLVYKGHVVMLTAVLGNGRGDIIHATGGKDIKLPGQGIQRERAVPLQSFRGPLLRILRHEALKQSMVGQGRLRPVIKR